MNDTKRVGRFLVAFGFVNQYPDLVAALLAELQFVPLRVEALYHMTALEYIGYSPRFEQIERGQLPTEYEIVAYSTMVDEIERITKFRIEKA